MASKGIVRYDQYLTNLSLAYPTGSLIAEMVAPIVPVENYSDKVFVDADDAIMQVNDEAESTPSNEVDFAVGTPYSYRTRRRAISSTLTNKEIDNSRNPVKLEQRETNKLTHRLKLKHEMRVSNILRSTSKVTQYTNIDAITNAQWDDPSAAADADLDYWLTTAINTIYDSTGVAANTMIVPFKAAMWLAMLPSIKDLLKYQYGMQLVTSQFQNQLMKLVGLPPVIRGLNLVISNGRVGAYNKGETAAVSSPWGKDCLIGYVPPSPQTEEMFGILTMEYDSRKVFTENKTDPFGKKIITEWDYDILEAELKCWYLLQNVIS